MLRIGVLSDTHFKSLGHGLPLLQRLIAGPFREVEIVLHAGDLVQPDILLAFVDRTVHAVRGNMDGPESDLPLRRVLEIGGFRIGLIHGWGAPEGLEERLVPEFKGEELHCLVYGHSHRPVCHRRDGILFFNPGSPTDQRWAPYPSVGLLELDRTIEGRILSLEE